jgi:polygalacturonase
LQKLAGPGVAGFSVRAVAAGGALSATTVFDVCKHGAPGEGKTKDTAPMQRAIDTAFQAGGGTILVLGVILPVL